MKLIYFKPVEKFLRSLPVNEKEIADPILDDVKIKGLSSAFVDPLGNGMFEIKIDTRDHWYRILFKQHKIPGETIALLAVGFAKTTNKTPKSEMDLCVDRVKAFLALLKEK